MRFLFLVTGLGEAAQGTAVALYASARGTDIKFVSTTAQCHDYIAGFGFEDILYSDELPTAQLRSHVNKGIEDYSPDAIFCCNSKTTEKMFHPESPEERPDCLIVSLDSNWLFEDMPAFFDRFFVVFPREIFQRNRNYVIDDDRVQPVGFVPSGYELQIRPRTQEGPRGDTRHVPMDHIREQYTTLGICHIRRQEDGGTQGSSCRKDKDVLG